MKISATCTSVVAVLCLGGCSNEAIYDTAQQNHALKCQKYPDSRYDDCMRTVEKPYNEYERELSEVDSNGESKQ